MRPALYDVRICKGRNIIIGSCSDLGTVVILLKSGLIYQVAVRLDQLSPLVM